MKPWIDRPFSQVIRLRIRVLWGVIALMLVYMVAVAELGGGDSRRMTDLAQFAYRAIFFGGLAYAIARLVGYKKMLRDRLRLREQLLAERDERNRYLHDKSGGLVMDVLLIGLLFLTCTCALFDMSAFYAAFAALAFAVALKLAAYWWARRMG